MPNHSTTPPKNQQANGATIIEAMQAILAPGQIQVTELRALSVTTPTYRKPHTVSGYFDDPEALAQAAAGITQAQAVYFIPNPITPALLARAANRARAVDREPLTSDTDITARRWLLLDVDPTRPAGISSTEAEHAAALRISRAIRDALSATGWPLPIEADSGNGAHLMYRIDLPTADDDLVKRCLEALAFQFNDAGATVDTTVFNPARLWKLYGTWARKGDDTTDRPHRLARLLTVPPALEIVPRQMLEDLATLPAPEPTEQAPTGSRRNGEAFDVAGWMRQHCPDAIGPMPWQSGSKWLFPVCPWNPDHRNRSAYVLQFASGAVAAGCHHNGCSGRTWQDLRAMKEPAATRRKPEADRPRRQQQRRKPEADAPAAGPVLLCLADVEPKAISWLWPARIPMGRITLLVGPGGLGKSFLITDLAARVSTGSPWPDGNGNAPLGSVILISAEDDPADTIRPRLDAHLADVSHVHMLSAVRWLDAEAKPKERMFSLADLPALETALQTHRDCKLVVVDPIGSFLGSDTDAHRDNEVRAILAPIAKLAERYAVAMLVIAHRRKAAGTLADDLALGSRAFTALARACWHLSRDPDNRERRLLLAGKNNLAKAGDGMAFTIAGDPPRIEWEREPVQMSADEALAHENDTHGPEPTERAGAEEWLREFLAKGPMRAGDIEKPEPGTIRYEAKTAGIKWATLRRAKVTVRAKAYRDFGVWFWKLPEPPLDPVQGAQNNLSHLHLTEKDEPLEPLEGNTRENTPQDALVNQVAHVLFPTRVRAREDEPQPPTPEDTAFRREERAAILEYDAGMTRAQAQEAAIAHDPHQTAPDAPGTIRRPSQDAEDHPTAGKPGKDKRP